ncbi:MAG: hypothetical protein QM767_25330 [Anaeromyxobacter sp.]
MYPGRLQLLVLVLTALTLVTVAWFLRTGRWRERRLLVFTVGLLAALGLLARRIGWGELLVLAVVVGLPLLLVTPGRPQPRGGPPARRR